MSRPLRIEFDGALYHVTSRGDRREPIFIDDGDRAGLLAVTGQGLTRFNARMLSYCLMSNHYHFVIGTAAANLSKLMRHINGVYTQAFNRRHAKVGHLFQGRFKSILVDRDSYLLEVCRYVELNPVRAALIGHPSDWQWSSYLAHTGQTQSPDWLDTAALHGYLLGRDAANAADRRRAARRYATLVEEGRDVDLWTDHLRQQIYLGDEGFVERMQSLAKPAAAADREVPIAQRRARARTMAHWLSIGETRDDAIRRAVRQGGLSMTAIAAEMGLSVSRISRLVAQGESTTVTKRESRKS